MTLDRAQRDVLIRGSTRQDRFGCAPRSARFQPKR